MKKWLNLRMSILPYLSIEVNNTYEHYFELIDEIRRNEDKEKMKEFKNFQLDITKRIKELETFYEDNISESLIFLVENAKIKLKKVLMYNTDVLNKIEANINYDLKTNLNCTNTKIEDFKTNPKAFDSPSKINFGSGFGTNQTNFRTNLENANSSTNIFNSNNQQYFSGKNFQSNLTAKQSNKSANQFNPISEVKTITLKNSNGLNTNNNNNNTNANNPYNSTRSKNLKESNSNINLNKNNNNSSPLLITNKIEGSATGKINPNNDNLTKNKTGKAELKRSHSQTGKEIIAKRIQKINLDNLNLGKNQEFSLLEFRNNYLDMEGNFMPLKHIAFKIKLTENEYRLLMKERMKMNKN